ncbi:hypothetical protein Ddc_17563 [Ditylenchus destructor]|nr:hypothetical protein Ddc_17563 [Ditylenchus destructor]
MKIVGFAAKVTAKMSFGSLLNCIKHPIKCFFGTIILTIVIGVLAVVMVGVTIYSLVQMHKNGGIWNNIKDMIQEFKEVKAKAKEAKNGLKAELHEFNDELNEINQGLQDQMNQNQGTGTNRNF